VSLLPIISNALVFGVVLGSILFATILVVVRINPEIMLRDYPPDVQAEHGPMSDRSKRQKPLVAILVLAEMFAVIVASLTPILDDAPAVGLLIIGLQLPATLTWLQQHYRQGIGYSSRGWKESETIAQLVTRMPSAVMYSNAPDVIYAILGRPATMIPRRTMTASNLPNPNYRAEIEQMTGTLRAANGVIVFFDRVNWRKYLPSAAELESSLGLRLVTKTNDGAIYQAH